jgi:hypothetical protein
MVRSVLVRRKLHRRLAAAFQDNQDDEADASDFVRRNYHQLNTAAFVFEFPFNGILPVHEFTGNDGYIAAWD